MIGHNEKTTQGAGAWFQCIDIQQRQKHDVNSSRKLTIDGPPIPAHPNHFCQWAENDWSACTILTLRGLKVAYHFTFTDLAVRLQLSVTFRGRNCGITRQHRCGQKYSKPVEIWKNSPVHDNSKNYSFVKYALSGWLRFQVASIWHLSVDSEFHRACLIRNIGFS